MTTDTTFGQKEKITVNNLYKTSSEWLEYFRCNRDNLFPIAWECSYRLSDREKATISSSIRSFQLGESSEGTNLLKAARVYAAVSGDNVYVEALKLFIGEEQRHAADLARFMKQQHIALARRHWTDTIFRKLRKLANLELAIVVLLTAELMALIYYKALGNATNSPELKQICQQILRDETAHVCFQSQQLGKMRQNRSRWQLFCLELLQRIFFNATLFVVWFDHGKVLRSGGYTFSSFASSAWLELNHTIQIMLPQDDK